MARSLVSPGSWKSRKAPALEVIGAFDTLMRAGTGINEAPVDGEIDGEAVDDGDAASVGDAVAGVGVVQDPTTRPANTRTHAMVLTPTVLRELRWSHDGFVMWFRSALATAEVDLPDAGQVVVGARGTAHRHHDRPQRHTWAKRQQYAGLGVQPQRRVGDTRWWRAHLTCIRARDIDQPRDARAYRWWRFSAPHEERAVALRPEDKWWRLGGERGSLLRKCARDTCVP